MPYPTISTLSGTVTWSDGSLFDGYLLLIIAFPVGYSSASIKNQLVVQPIGDHIKVRIIQGVYDQAARIYQNLFLEPPNTQYVAYYFDNNDKELGHTGLFTIATSPYTITQPTLALPAATIIIPSP